MKLRECFHTIFIFVPLVPPYCTAETSWLWSLNEWIWFFCLTFFSAFLMFAQTNPQNTSEEAEIVSNEKTDASSEAVAPDKDEKSPEATEVKPRKEESKTPKANLRKFFKLVSGTLWIAARLRVWEGGWLCLKLFPSSLSKVQERRHACLQQPGMPLLTQHPEHSASCSSLWRLGRGLPGAAAARPAPSWPQLPCPGGPGPFRGDPAAWSASVPSASRIASAGWEAWGAAPRGRWNVSAPLWALGLLQGVLLLPLKPVTAACAQLARLARTKMQLLLQWCYKWDDRKARSRV